MLAIFLYISKELSIEKISKNKALIILIAVEVVSSSCEYIIVDNKIYQDVIEVENESSKTCIYNRIHAS